MAEGIDKDRLIRAQNRQLRKLEDKLNRFAKLVPGSQRIWYLDTIAMEMEYEANILDTEHRDDEADGVRKNALFMRRMQWDLHQLRNTVRGPRGGRMEDIETYYMRERP
jgi:hypothetical protein